ncbi:MULTISPECIES: hypothetical protein [Prochlorococcus]|uniref:Uncharacterized protein n=1 Tax=Prochlorococcus marinus (strain SARG / CCMP1375 / SS120) TaxID=167539 RepID=Q7VCR9_PROMA|nr:MULTISPECIES: hypothetical protein [Prochlorococcus]AAP99715.1 Predicted protein [Prochlorococcus marinus subsp. marinus str. CCMP1375]KGG13384.1 hypothetical protein EV04_0619 [Prochlorococcus marinus str. LG]KGG21372.1 hypothetical protein EV08_0780 [Prochlorococcus marinus str. SS2]KGG24296.1 hypothetical protein EV09_0343 [Prochlorococcus marinus str. SS35]KGG33580.1 hypothetical protein EV10_0420 [Prochlorococcus marinus str. SS51]
MALKDKLLTKVFSSEGTEKSKEAVKPMKPENILPIFQIALAFLIAGICITPIAINVINQGGL